MHAVSKSFDFCYGHRVWSQQLNAEFSLDSCLACRHLHGHQGKITIHLEAEQLTAGMVTDFKHMNWFKKWLDDTLDHKFIMDLADPLFVVEVSRDHFKTGNRMVSFGRENSWAVIDNKDLREDTHQAVKEKYEGMVFVKFVPTSENLAKWIYEVVSERMKPLGIKVAKITFNETPKTEASYSE